MTPEEQARIQIDQLLHYAGWEVQDRARMSLFGRPGRAAGAHPRRAPGAMESYNRQRSALSFSPVKFFTLTNIMAKLARAERLLQEVLGKAFRGELAEAIANMDVDL